MSVLEYKNKAFIYLIWRSKWKWSFIANYLTSKLLILSNTPLVNTSANTQGSVMMAITKMKQLLNELSYLVMATIANAIISPCLAVCVARFASVHSRSKSASLINSSLNYRMLFFFLSAAKDTVHLRLSNRLLLTTQRHLPKMAEWPCCVATVCHWPALTPHPAPLSASHLPLATHHITLLAISGQWDDLGYHGDRTNRETSCQEFFSVLALPASPPCSHSSATASRLAPASSSASPLSNLRHRVCRNYMFVVVSVCVCLCCVWQASLRQ